MSSQVSDKATTQLLNRHLNQARQNAADALEKLSSGQVFTSQDIRPADRALTKSLEFKLRSLSASKKNINDAVSLLQTAEAGFSEISNILIRMKEINTAAVSATISDQDRRYLFIEHEALHQELDRIAKTTNYNNIPLLNGEDRNAPQELIFRVGDPHLAAGSPNPSNDWNEIRIDNIRDIIATTAGFGIKSANKHIKSSRGVTLKQAEDLLKAKDHRQFSSVYDEALNQLNVYRSQYGAIQDRLQKAIDYNSVIEENIAAAKSKIADTDYAVELSNLASSQIMAQASTALLAQTNFNVNLALSLMNSIVR